MISSSIPSLKRSKAKVSEGVPSKKSDIQVFEVAGNLNTQYCQAVIDMADAEARVNELKPLVLETGLRHIYEVNISNPTNPVSSVKTTDERGATVRVTAQNKYSAVNPDMVMVLFEQLGATHADVDPNNYVQEIVKPAFDTKVLYDVDGDFSDSIFNAYSNAIKAVTRQLVAAGTLPAGTESPLVGKRMFMPKPTFHAIRWTDFQTVDEQLAIARTLTNTNTVTPVVE